MRADLLSRAAGLIAPSRYMEPFGYNAIEAAMSGTPVICPDWGGFTETVLHGITGFRCRNMDQFDWSVRNIRRIDPEACRKWALENYTVTQAQARYEEYFKQLRGVFFGCDFNGSDPDRTNVVGPARTYPNGKPASVDAKEAPAATVLIPTYNRNDLLELGLASIRAHEFPGELEILVLDEGTQSAEPVAKRYGAKYVQTRAGDSAGWRVPGYAFNIGAKMAQGDVLVLTCPEIYHHENCLAHMVQACTTDMLSMVIPHGLDDDGRVLRRLQAGAPIGDDYPDMQALNTTLPFLLAVKKSIYLEVGGYDEDFTGRGYDDNDFVDRLIARGLHYTHVDKQIIHLYHSRAPRGPDDGQRFQFNKRLYEDRKGQIIRNVGKAWGIL